MKKIAFLLIVIAGLLASGCLYESEVPFTYQKGSVNPQLIGSWETMQPGDFYLKISMNNDNIRLTLQDKVTHAVEETMNGYCARLGGIPFIIFKDDSDGETKYSFIKYAFEKNNELLKITAFGEDIFSENNKVQYFKTATELRNFMLKNIEKFRAFEDEDFTISYMRKNSAAHKAWQEEQEKIAAKYPVTAENAFSSEYAVGKSSVACPTEFLGTWMHDSKIKRVKISAADRLLREYSVSVSVLSHNTDNTWQWQDFQPGELKFFDVKGQKLVMQKAGTRYYYFQFSKQNGKLAIRYVSADYVKKYRPAYEFDGDYDLSEFFERHLDRPGFFTNPFFLSPEGKNAVLTLEEEKRKVWDTWFARYGYQDAPYDRSAGKYNPKVTFETKYESSLIGKGLWIATVQWATAKNETGECSMIYDPEGEMRIFSENPVAQRLAQQEASGQRPTQTYSQTNNSKQNDSDDEELKSRAMLGLLGMLIVGGLILSATSNESSYQSPATYRQEVVGYDRSGLPITSGPTSATKYYDADGKRIKWD